MLESSPNHSIPCLLVCGKIVFHETGSWCQKGWEPRIYKVLRTVPHTPELPISNSAVITLFCPEGLES